MTAQPAASSPCPRLPPDRRDRRVGDPGRRRQGQGTQGRRPPGDRLRRRRARLRRRPTTSSRRRSRPRRDPRNHRYTPAGGLPELKAAIAAKTQRDSGYARRGQPGAGHQRRQAGRLRGVRDPARPGRRGDPAGAVLDDLPRGDPARRRRAGRRTRRRDPGLPRHRRPARGGPDRARPRCCCSARRPTRPARSTRPSRCARSASGRSSTASGW